MTPTQKIGGIIHINDEARWRALGGEHQRHAEILHGPVTTEKAAAHAKAVEALAYLRDSPDYVEGGPDFESEILPLRTAETVLFTETHAEWVARCQELDRQRT